MAAVLGKIRGLTAVIGVLSIVLVAMTAYTVHVFHGQQEKQGQIAVMTQTIKDWQEKATRFQTLRKRERDSLWATS